MLHSRLEKLIFYIAVQAISKRGASHRESRDYASMRGLYCNPLLWKPSHLYARDCESEEKGKIKFQSKTKSIKKPWYNRDYVGTSDSRGRQLETFRHKQYPSILRRSLNVFGQQVEITGFIHFPRLTWNLKGAL